MPTNRFVEPDETGMLVDMFFDGELGKGQRNVKSKVSYAGFSGHHIGARHSAGGTRPPSRPGRPRKKRTSGCRSGLCRRSPQSRRHGRARRISRTSRFDEAMNCRSGCNNSSLGRSDATNIKVSAESNDGPTQRVPGRTKVFCYAGALRAGSQAQPGQAALTQGCWAERRPLFTSGQPIGTTAENSQHRIYAADLNRIGGLEGPQRNTVSAPGFAEAGR